MMKKVFTLLFLFLTISIFGQGYWDQRRVNIQYDAVRAVDSLVVDTLLTGNGEETLRKEPTDAGRIWTINFLSRNLFCDSLDKAYIAVRFDNGAARLNFPSLFTILFKKDDSTYVRLPLRGSAKELSTLESIIDTNCLYFGYNGYGRDVTFDMIGFVDTMFIHENGIQEDDTVYIVNSYYKYDQGTVIDNISFGDNVDFTQTSINDNIKAVKNFLLHYINTGTGDTGTLQYPSSIWAYPLNIGPFAGAGWVGAPGNLTIGVRANQNSNKGAYEGMYIGTLGRIGYGKISESLLNSAKQPQYSLPFGPDRLGENTAIGYRLYANGMSSSVAIGAKLGDPGVVIGDGGTYIDGSVVIGSNAAQAGLGVDSRIYNSIGIGTKVFEVTDLVQDVIAIGADQLAETTNMSALNAIAIGNAWSVNEPDSIYNTIWIGHRSGNVGGNLSHYNIVIGNDVTPPAEGSDSATITFPTGWEILGAKIGGSQIINPYITDISTVNDITTYLQAGSDPSGVFDDYQGFAAIVQDNDTSEYKHDMWLDGNGFGLYIDSKLSNSTTQITVDTTTSDLIFTSNRGVMNYGGDYRNRYTARSIPELEYLSQAKHIEWGLRNNQAGYLLDAQNSKAVDATTSNDSDGFYISRVLYDQGGITPIIFTELYYGVGPYQGEQLYYEERLTKQFWKNTYYWNSYSDLTIITLKENGDWQYEGTGSLVYGADYSTKFDNDSRSIPDVAWIRDEISDSIAAIPTPTFDDVLEEGSSSSITTDLYVETTNGTNFTSLNVDNNGIFEVRSYDNSENVYFGRFTVSRNFGVELGYDNITTNESVSLTMNPNSRFDLYSKTFLNLNPDDSVFVQAPLQGLSDYSTSYNDFSFVQRGYVKGLTASVQTVNTTSDTVETNVNTVIVDDDTAGGAVTLYFKTASSYAAGKNITIIKKGSTANITLDGSGAETINGTTTTTLTTQWEQAVVLTDGTEWYKR